MVISVSVGWPLDGRDFKGLSGSASQPSMRVSRTLTRRALLLSAGSSYAPGVLRDFNHLRALIPPASPTATAI